MRENKRRLSRNNRTSRKLAVNQISKKRLETRQLLFVAARKQFTKFGISGTGLEELTASAGLTRGAYYSNFDSIDDFLLAFIQNEYQELFESLQLLQQAFDQELQDIEFDQTLTNQQLALQVWSQLLAKPTVQRAMMMPRDWVVSMVELALYIGRNPQAQPEIVGLHLEMLERVAQMIDHLTERFGLQLVIGSEECAAAIVSLFRSEYISLAFNLQASSNQLTPSEQLTQVLLPYYLAGMVDPASSRH